MSARIEIDRRSLGALEYNFEEIKKQIPRATYQGILKYLTLVKANAQNRLKEKGHIVTSRLRNSIYIQTPKAENIPNNSETYKDDDDNVWNGRLTTVNLKENEAAVGSNVEYSGPMERRDSFLWWAIKNTTTAAMAQEYNKQVSQIKLKK